MNLLSILHAKYKGLHCRVGEETEYKLIQVEIFTSERLEHLQPH